MKGLYKSAEFKTHAEHFLVETQWTSFHPHKTMDYVG